MNLTNERLHVLKLLNADPDRQLIVDPSLPGILRRQLGLIKGGEVEDYGAALGVLLQEHEKNGLAFFRCLLEYAYLLHSAFDVRQQFAGLFDYVRDDLQGSRELLESLTQELSFYVQSPYDVTREMVRLAMERLAEAPGFLENVIRNRRWHYALRYLAAELVVQRKLEASYSALVKFLVELMQDGSTQNHVKRVRPLLQLLSQTGSAGLEIVYDSIRNDFAHAPLIYSSFGDAFHDWFYKQEFPPAENWARVLLSAWRNSQSLLNRDRMLEYVVDNYCRSPKIAEFVSSLIRQKLRESPRYLATCSHALRNRVLAFAGDTRLEAEALTRKLVEAAVSDGAWRRVAGTLALDMAGGRALAAALVEARSDEHRLRMLELLQRPNSNRFRTGFYQCIVSPSNFLRLSGDVQRRVLQPRLRQHVTSDLVERLLNAAPALDARVREMLQEVLRDLVRLTRGISSSDTTGGLE